MLFRSKSFFICLILLYGAGLYSQDKKTVRISIKEAVANVIEHNLTVKNAKLEILKTDTPELKNHGKFNWTVFGEVTSFKTQNPVNQTTILSGTKVSNDRIAAGIEKQFHTGTYFMAEISTVRFDANAFEGQSAYLNSRLAFLAIKPLYTGALTFKLSQELWKYSFGKYEKNKEKILQTQAAIDRDQLVFLLSNIVAKTLIDYWSLAILDNAVLTYEKLLKNAKQIRGITYEKQRIGIAEAFDGSMWNSIVAGLESQVERAKLDRYAAEVNLKRILGVDPSMQVEGVTDLIEEIPSGISYEKDLAYAYEKRIELRNLKRLREKSRLQRKNAEEEDEPSVKLSAMYSTRGQTLLSPQENYINTGQGILSLKYPEARAEINISYPLWDEGVKETLREAKVNEKQIEEQEEAFRKEVAVELRNRIDAINTSYLTLKNAKKAKEETDRYFRGLYAKYSSGRFTSLMVKNALDALAQSELQIIQAKVNFNINLVRYDLVKN
ncbi:MAG TPA: TolC family protein, partial [Leptospiraceae bacterium]|nr:TolC family protein [Leptospiraceae bacterium]